MEKKFKIQLVERVPLIEVDGKKVFIDTGSPSSFSNEASFSFMGTNHKVKKNVKLKVEKGMPSNMAPDHLDKILATEISTHIGLDIIGMYDVLIDYRAGIIEFSDEPINIDTDDVHILPTVKYKGMSRPQVKPILNFAVSKHAIKCYCDTGAANSFLYFGDKNLARDGKYLSNKPGYIPMAGGDCVLEIYKVPVEHNNMQFMAECFVIKESLQEEKLKKVMLDGKGADGLMGYDFFYHHQVLLHKFENNEGRMSVKRYA